MAIQIGNLSNRRKVMAKYDHSMKISPVAKLMALSALTVKLNAKATKA